MMVNDRFKTHVKYEGDGKGFQMYSHPFGWQQCSQADLENTSKNLLALYKAEPKVEFIIKGGGYRKKSSAQDDAILDDNELLCKEFLQDDVMKKAKVNSSCMWLSACMVVNEFDKDEAKRMLSSLVRDPKAYDWMYLFKYPQNENVSGKILVDELSKCSKFQLQKVKGVGNVTDRLDFLLNPSSTGKYICQLRTNANVCQHTVGVDCDKKMIYDCMEKKKLPLTRESFDQCCGQHQNGIKEIGYWGKVVMQRQKK